MFEVGVKANVNVLKPPQRTDFLSARHRPTFSGGTCAVRFTMRVKANAMRSEIDDVAKPALTFSGIHCHLCCRPSASYVITRSQERLSHAAVEVCWWAHSSAHRDSQRFRVRWQ